jgi:hypothetical protein
MKRRSFIKNTALSSVAASVLSYPHLLSGQTLAEKPENIVFPRNAQAVIDITKPPYNCDNRGIKDCTKALILAMDDLLRPTLKAQKTLVKEMEEDPRQDFNHPVSVESKKIKGVVSVIFPTHPAPSKILYFPDGTYKISNTILYSFEDLNNTAKNELNRQIIIRGQSEKGTIIRLQDYCTGFEKGNNKPVFSFMRKYQSNVAMANFFENLTINIGNGNPGASGLRFFCNNMGAVRNVTIKSEDLSGSSGILCDRFNLSGCYFKNITIKGFDYGIQVLPNRMYTVFEHITLLNQKTAGFLIDGNPVSIRDLQSENSVSALLMTGDAGHCVLLDSHLNKPSTGDHPNSPAIELQHGLLFARNIETKGYPMAVGKMGNEIIKGPEISEYSSHGVFTLSENEPQKSLNLPVEETPDIPWEQNLSQWVSVNEFGARGDGETDCTQAIQKAFNSGKKVIYFQPGRYLINDQITVPRSVQRINFMFSDLVAGEKLRNMAEQGTFKIIGDSEAPLIIEDLFAFEEYRGQQYFIDHACRRTLVLSDLHTQTGAMYFNSVSGGKVFIENCCCTDQFPPNPNCYKFTGQKVWARQINPERANPEVINDGSQLWVMGFKTENRGTGFKTVNRGSTEVLGGVINIGGEGNSFIINDESSVSISCATNGWLSSQSFNDVVLEKRNGEERILQRDQLPKRILFKGYPTTGAQKDYFVEQYFIPLYSGKK